MPLFSKLDSLHETAPALSVTVDGRAVDAEAGECVAAVLLRLDPLLTRSTDVKRSPRAPFCMMGVCFECLAVVDGAASTQTCMVEVRSGMCIERQQGRRELVAPMDPAAVDDCGKGPLETPSAQVRP